MLDSAVALYTQGAVEAARPILQSIVSPNFLQVVTPSQKAEALTYLGAAAAVLATSRAGQDSAITYFKGALDFDPFIDLDPTKFTPAEQAAFGLAKSSLFKVALRPFAGSSLVQKDSMPLRIDFITTQRANVRVDLAGPRDTILIFQDLSDGQRPIRWPGVMSNGEYVPAGVYQLRITGTQASGSPPETQTSSISLRIEHLHEPLETELPPLDSLNRNQLLPERIRPSEPWFDIIKGASVAVVAVGVPMAVLNTGDIAWTAHAGVTALIGAGAGALSYFIRSRNPQIRTNVEENAIRRRYRDEFNAQVARNNRARLARTLLVISPVAAVGQ